MQYYSRAGLVALLFTIIISLVSAVPIPESISSSTLSPRMSTLPLSTRLTRRQFLTDTDEQLVRRRGSSSGGKIKNPAQNLWRKIKSGFSFQKAGTEPIKYGKLPRKEMNVMNKVIGYIPREFSEDEGFQQRDIDEAYHFEERDDIA